MIEDLILQRTEIVESTWLWLIGIVIGFGLFGTGVVKRDDNKNWDVVIVLGLVIVGFCFVFAFMERIEIDKIEEQISDIYKNQLMSMECPELRNTFLELLEKDKLEWWESDRFEWMQSYHDTKCETPLRAEVMKLQ